MNFNIDATVTGAIAGDWILNHKDASSVIFPHALACWAKRGVVKV